MDEKIYQIVFKIGDGEYNRLQKLYTDKGEAVIEMIDLKQRMDIYDFDIMEIIPEITEDGIVIREFEERLLGDEIYFDATRPDEEMEDFYWNRDRAEILNSRPQ